MVEIFSCRKSIWLAVIFRALLAVTSCQDTDRNGPPYIGIFAKEKQQYFYQGQAFTLPCKACGTSITYSWQKDGRSISKSSKNGDLSLTFSSDSSGVYRCFASNEFGISVSDETHINETFLSVESSGSSSKATAAIRSSYRFKCQFESVPMHSTDVTWTKNSEKVDLGNRITTDFNGDLYITKVTSVDEGTYRCSISNRLMEQSKPGNTYQFSQTTRDKAISKVTLLWMSEQTTMNFVGDNLRLKCIFSGDNYPINWTVLSKSARGSNLKTSELSINNLTLSDAGQYKCEYEGRTYTFEVNVQEKPYWVIEPKSLELYPGATAEFQCEAAGTPLPYPRWFINGRSFSDSAHPAIKEGRLQQVSNTKARGTLTLQSVTTSDMMAVQCLCENTHGSVYADVYLQVLDYPSTVGDITTPTPQTTTSSTILTQTITLIQTTAQTTPQKNTSANQSSNGATIGGAVAGVLIVIILVAVISFIVIYRRRNKRNQKEAVITNQSYENVDFKETPTDTHTHASYETLESGGIVPPNTYDSLKPQSIDGLYVDIIDSVDKPKLPQNAAQLGDSVNYENVEKSVKSTPAQSQNSKESGIVKDTDHEYLEFT